MNPAIPFTDRINKPILCRQAIFVHRKHCKLHKIVRIVGTLDELYSLCITERKQLYNIPLYIQMYIQILKYVIYATFIITPVDHAIARYIAASGAKCMSNADLHTVSPTVGGHTELLLQREETLASPYWHCYFHHWHRSRTWYTHELRPHRRELHTRTALYSACSL